MMFAQRRSELQTAITAYTAVGVDAVNAGIALIGVKATVTDGKLDLILAELRKLNSSRERDLLKFLDLNGGPENCIDDDRLMKQLLVISGEVTSSETAGSDGRIGKMIPNLRRALKTDLKSLETVLKDNLSRFEKLLHIQMDNFGNSREDNNIKLDQLKTLLIDQGKIIEKSLASNSATLNDPVCLVLLIYLSVLNP